MHGCLFCIVGGSLLLMTRFAVNSTYLFDLPDVQPASAKSHLSNLQVTPVLSATTHGFQSYRSVDNAKPLRSWTLVWSGGSL